LRYPTLDELENNDVKVIEGDAGRFGAASFKQDHSDKVVLIDKFAGLELVILYALGQAREELG